MSSSHNVSSETVDRDQQLLSIGKQCHLDTCHLVDFLPFKCQHCSEAFCQEHFLPAAHTCPKYDETKHNRVAPSCPMCNVPVAIKPGQDPNERMEQHFTRECSVMTGRAPKKSGPVCEKARCGKALVSPIRCDKCRKQFCAAHRFPSDHTCTPAAPTTSARLGAKSNQIRDAARDALRKNTSPSAVKPTTASSKPSASSEAATKKVDLSKLKLQNPVAAVKVDRSPTPPSPMPTSCAVQSANATTTTKRNPYAPPPLFAY
ncbi:hypothetical protein K523DRAFT_418980 [Schizophyllum commune Tattone D]|nr:hypothetical protein K525DRAFT_258142 [Schizophyllum commune Loenen D]KAI5826788.1 hypothetical protein K523DRAFT_418980 [Schizophyllum commune Tattone D]